VGCKIASGPIAGPLDSGFFIKLNLGRLAKTGVAILEAHRQVQLILYGSFWNMLCMAAKNIATIRLLAIIMLQCRICKIIFILPYITLARYLQLSCLKLSFFRGLPQIISKGHPLRLFQGWFSSHSLCAWCHPCGSGKPQGRRVIP